MRYVRSVYVQVHTEDSDPFVNISIIKHCDLNVFLSSRPEPSTSILISRCDFL